jgi:hypothetical protein
MRHPRSIAERRQNRRTIMARRREIIRNWYAPDGNTKPEDNRAWTLCNKWNLNCGCMLCHLEKYYSARRQRRNRLKKDILDSLAAWM